MDTSWELMGVWWRHRQLGVYVGSSSRLRPTVQRICRSQLSSMCDVMRAHSRWSSDSPVKDISAKPSSLTTCPWLATLMLWPARFSSLWNLIWSTSGCFRHYYWSLPRVCECRFVVSVIFAAASIAYCHCPCLQHCFNYLHGQCSCPNCCSSSCLALEPLERGCRRRFVGSLF